MIRREHWCEWLYRTDNGESEWRNLFAWRLFSKHCCELDACNVMWEYLLSISSHLFTFRQQKNIILNKYLATRYRNWTEVVECLKKYSDFYNFLKFSYIHFNWSGKRYHHHNNIWIYNWSYISLINVLYVGGRIQIDLSCWLELTQTKLGYPISMKRILILNVTARPV